jgi:hypothetical protein
MPPPPDPPSPPPGLDLNDIYTRRRNFRTYVIKSVWNLHGTAMCLGILVALTDACKTWPTPEAATVAMLGSYVGLGVLFTYAPWVYARWWEVICEFAMMTAFIARHAALARGERKWFIVGLSCYSLTPGVQDCGLHFRVLSVVNCFFLPAKPLPGVRLVTWTGTRLGVINFDAQ